MSALNAANEDGIPLWQLTSANLSDYLAVATISQSMKQQIANAVGNGWQVMAQEAPVTMGRWRGQAYVAVDPETGSGAYIIGSGTNGGEFESCEIKMQPLLESITQRILTQAALRIAVGLAAEAGLAVGAVLAPPAAPWLAQAMVMVGITFLTFSANAASANGPCGKSSKDCHRGRFQAQGLDILRNSGSDTRSRSWALPTPPTLANSLSYLNELKLQLLPTELTRRLGYFAQMESYVQTAAAAGGICSPFPGKSFQSLDPSSSDSKDRVRVDLEINAGQAFGN